MIHPRKFEACAAIREHLQQAGSKNWGSLRHRIDFIGPATFWRWVRETKEGQVGPQLLASSARREHVVSPDGDAQRVDFLAAYHGLWADAKRLETHALHDDGRVRSPAVLDRSIRIRLKLLRQGLDLERQIFSARAQRAFYDGLVEEIAKESTEVRTRLINRLRSFNRGFDAQQSSTAASGS
jgi:hypothetical protein